MPVLSQFLRRNEGGVAILFGLALFPLLFVAGAAVDYSRAGDLHSRLSAATDAVSLLLCKTPGTTTAAQLQAKAQSAAQAYMPNTPITVDPLQITADPRVITMTSRLSYPTAFVKIANFNTMDVAATATCSASETFFEIALVIDTSGSMWESSGSTSKMEAAKEAGKKFVEYMFTTGARPGHVKISLVPFSATVAVDPATYRNASWIDQNGKSKYHWQNVKGTTGVFTNRFGIFDKLRAGYINWDWKGCLESLAYPLNTQDGAPSPANPDSYYLPLFSPDEIGNVLRPGPPDPWQDKSLNSYLDDGPAKNGSCQYDALDNARFTQACKYSSTLKNIRTDQGGPNWKCTSRPLMRLSNNQGALTTELTQYQPGQGTNIHQGFVWGWQTVSPLGVFADATAYTAPNTVKVVVLMTDGVNTWPVENKPAPTRSEHSAYGYLSNGDGSDASSRLPPAKANPVTDADSRAAIDALTLETCRNAAAKPSSVIIYTVGFSTPSNPIDGPGLDLLRNCAGSSERFFVANDSTALVAAFGNIAQGIGQLRITR